MNPTEKKSNTPKPKHVKFKFSEVKDSEGEEQDLMSSSNNLRTSQPCSDKDLIKTFTGFKIVKTDTVKSNQTE